MRIPTLFKVSCFFALYASAASAATQYENTHLIEGFKSFKEANYQRSLKELQQVFGARKILASRFYLEGLVHNRLQEYDISIKKFQKAIINGHQSDDLYYEMAQAYYANSDLEKARSFFLKSYKVKFKQEICLYYSAYISQTLEEFKKAKKYYLMLVKVTKKDKKLQQVARFQLAESFLSMIQKRDNPARLVNKYILPRMESALKLLPKGETAQDIEKRKKEIMRQYGLDPNLMKNGKVLDKKRFSGNFNHKISYDSNITLATELTSQQSLQRDTMIHVSTMNLQRLFSHKGLFTFTPYTNLSNYYHSTREESTIHQNDTQNISVGSRNTYEHMLFGKQASLLFDFDHTYTRRDRDANKQVRFFARTNTFNLGEQFNYIDSGPTALSFDYKKYDAHDDTLNFRNIGLSIGQILVTESGNVYNAIFRVDFLDTFNNAETVSDSYAATLSYIIPDILPSYTFTSTLALTLLNPKNAKEARGWEKTIAPTVEISKTLSDTFSGTLGFDYTKNISKDKESFDYKKYVLRFEISASF